MIHVKGEADKNHIEHFRRLYGDALYVRPCPWNGESFSPYTTLFYKDGVYGFVTALKPVYYMHRNRTFRPLSEVTSHHGNKKIILNEKWGQIHPEYLAWLSARQKRLKGTLDIPSPLGKVILTNEWLKKNIPLGLTAFGPVYPTTGLNDPVDDYCFRGPVTEAIGTIRAGTGSGIGGGTDAHNWTVWARSTASAFQYLIRQICIFDTSSITSGATVNTATFSQKCYATQTAFAPVTKPAMHIFFATTAANNTLAAGDYTSNNGHTSIGSNTFSTIDGNKNTTPGSATYNDFTLSSTASVNTGTGARTKIGGALDWDTNNNDTGASYGAGRDFYYELYLADTPSTGDDPKLAGTFTAGGGGTVEAPQETPVMIFS